MDQLLNEDSETMVSTSIGENEIQEMLSLAQVLKVSLYILSRSEKTHEDGQRIELGRWGKEYYGKPDLKGILEKELQKVPGKLLVTGMWSLAFDATKLTIIVSADSQTQDELRRLVLSSSERVEFQELDFQPHEKYNRFWAPKKQTTHIGVAWVFFLQENYSV